MRSRRPALFVSCVLAFLAALTAPPCSAGEITVAGHVTIPGYERVRTAYTVTVFDDGSVRTTIVGEHAIVIRGGDRDGERETIAEHRVDEPSPKGVPEGSVTTYPEEVIEVVPPEQQWETVTVPHDSDLELAMLVESSDIVTPAVTDDPPSVLEERVAPLASPLEADVELAAMQSEQADAEAVAAVDEVAPEANAALIGDPVSVATGQLVLEGADVVLAAGAIRLEIGRTHRTDERVAGSLGTGWHFSLDTRIVLGRSTRVGLAAETASRAYQSLTDADDGILAELNALIDDAVRQRRIRADAARTAYSQARSLEDALRDVDYGGPLAAEVHAELDRQEAEAAGIAAELERYFRALDGEVRTIEREVGPAARAELDDIAGDMLQTARRLQVEAARSAEHAARNERFAAGPAPESAAEAGNDSVTLVGPDGRSHRYVVRCAPQIHPRAEYRDGSRNVFPGGCALSSAYPTQDELRLMPDGTFRLERHDRTTWHYGFYGALRRVEDRNGNWIACTYDTSERLARLTDSRGREVRFERDEAGRVVRVVAPAALEIEYAYDADGRLAAVTDEVGDTTRYTYAGDGAGVRIVGIARPDGTGRTYTYGLVRGRRRVVSVVDEEGAVERFDFSSPGATRYTNPSGLEWVHHLDTDHRTIRIDHPGGRCERFAYSETGERTFHRDTAGNETTYRYDGRGRRTAIRFPDGTEETWTYTAYDLPETHTSRRGLVTRSSYDGRGNLRRVDHPDGTSDRYTRVPPGDPAAGEVATHTGRRGNTTTYAYDPRGYLERVTDALGPVATYEHDAFGRAVTATNGEGETTEISYRADGRVQERRGPGGSRTVYEYDARKDLVAVVENGNRTAFTYDARHLLVRVTNPIGEQTRYEYRADGEVVAREILSAPGADGDGPDGRLVSRTEYAYDERGLVEAERHTGIGTVRRFEYDAAGRLSAVTDAAGSREEFAYTFDGRVTERTTFRGEQPLTDGFRYLPGGPLERFTNAAGDVTRWNDDPSRRTRTERRPDGSRGDVVTYDPYGLVVRVADPTNRSRHARYDARGRLIEVRNDDYAEVAYAYDRADRVVASTDGTGATRHYEYDEAGRMIAVTLPDGATRTASWNADGTLAATRDETGLVTRFEYDGLGRLVARTQTERRTGYTWHYLGGLGSTTDPTGRTTGYEFDRAGRVVGIVDPAGALTAYELDPAGRVLRETDPTGRTRSYEYDEAGRLTATGRGGVIEARYEYDALGRLVEQTDGLGQPHRYEYDVLGRLVAETNRAGATRHFEHDAAGRLVATVGYTGTLARSSYDAAGRLTGVAFSDGAFLAYEHDRAGRIVAATNEHEHLGFAYDECGRLVAATGSATGTDLAYAYDAAGRRTTRRNNTSSTRTDYRYDARGFLVCVDDSAAGPISLAYDAAGRRDTVATPNGLTTSVRYDAAGRNAATVVTDADGSVIDAVAHVYDAAGRRRYDIDDEARVTGYGYDAQGRLVQVQYPYAGPKRLHDYRRFADLGLVAPGAEEAASANTAVHDYLSVTPDDASDLARAFQQIYPLRKSPLLLYQQVWSEHYEYDTAGNRVAWRTGWGTARYTFDTQGRLAGAGERVYDHDVAGNLVRAEGHPGITAYEYSAHHRLTRITTPEATVAYAYDALGRRIVRAETASGSVSHTDPLDKSPDPTPTTRHTIYRYDGLERTVSSRDEVERVGTAGSGELIKPRVTPTERFRALHHDPLLADGLAGTRHRYTEVAVAGEVLAITGPDAVCYLSHDSLGSVRTVSSSTASLPAHYAYDAFGSSLTRPQQPAQPYGYTGKPRDPSTGLYDYGFRDYHPKLGRFSTPDPIKDGTNWYAYVNNDPVNFVDPWGLCAESDDGGGGGTTHLGVFDPTRDPAARDPSEGFIQPTYGVVTDGFGERGARETPEGVVPAGLHPGVDFAAPIGTPVMASSSGVILDAGATPGYGHYVIMAHDRQGWRGVTSRYAHLHRGSVYGAGDFVEQGNTIGVVGTSGRSTGPHLHFEIRVGNRPVDPYSFLGE